MRYYKEKMKTVGRVVAGLCFVPVLAVPADFLWRFGEEPWKEMPLRWLPHGLLPVYMLLMVTMIPYGLSIGVTELSRKIGSPAARGLFGGMVAMLWFDTVLITLPSIGVYPNYVSVMVANLITKDDSWGRSTWIWVLVLNAVLWPAMGMAVGVFRGRKKPATR
jgi:hypothetical protein